MIPEQLGVLSQMGFPESSRPTDNSLGSVPHAKKHKASKHLRFRVQDPLALLNMGRVALEIAPYSNSQTAGSKKSIGGGGAGAEILTIDSSM